MGLWEERSPPVLRVDAGERDAAHWVMAAKEEPVRRRVGIVTPGKGGTQGLSLGAPQGLHAHTSFGCLSV